MDYRKLDNLGISVSMLGFGCMRFPTLENGEINEPVAEQMLRRAYEQGVNYFDTAYPYHGGASEPFVGRVLDQFDRKNYYLATKLPCWEVHSLDDAKRLFESQLTRLHKNYVDFYLLHALNKDRFREMVALGVVEYCEQLKAQGKIRYLGFSFHDEYASIEEIITYRKWDFCQLQLNYMDVDDQAGIKGYVLAEQLGIPVVVMEPVKGGSLANLPEDIASILRGIRPQASASSWAMRWVGSLPGVKVILSGMSTPEQVEDNLKTFTGFEPLTTAECKALLDTASTMHSRVHNGCTGCNYCMPCPAGVNIPYNFRIWNQFGIYGNKGQALWEWGGNIDDKQKAKNCVACGQCEAACPQHISIIEDLKCLQRELDGLNA